MPVLLAFKGPPGTGKSTLVRAVGARLGWPVIDVVDWLRTYGIKRGR